MLSRSLRPSLLAAAATVLGGGCIDMDMQTTLAADGSGTMSMKLGLTEGFVKILGKLRDIDPDQEVLDGVKELEFEEPTAEMKAAMKEAGCELLEFEGERSETKVYSRFKVAFEHLGALEELGRMDADEDDGGSGPGQGMTLVKNDDGSYTLSMPKPDDDDESDAPAGGEDGMGGAAGEDAAGDAGGPEEDPEEAMRKAAAAMELMGEMMAEMANLEVVIGMEVPGDVVSFEPADFAKQDGRKVTWTIDMAAAMGGGTNGMNDGFSVTFKMPAGTSIPAAALTGSASK